MVSLPSVSNKPVAPSSRVELRLPRSRKIAGELSDRLDITGRLRHQSAFTLDEHETTGPLSSGSAVGVLFSTLRYHIGLSLLQRKKTCESNSLPSGQKEECYLYR